MNYLPKNLTFEEGVAFINGFSLIDIASEHGTPLYVYDWNHIENNISFRYDSNHIYKEVFHVLMRYL